MKDIDGRPRTLHRQGEKNCLATAMAYRQPSERRDRSGDMATTSYLEHFLEQISTLPDKTQDALDQIRHLDDRINTFVSDAQSAATSTIARSNARGMPLENARRSYHEFIHFQKNAVELSDKKVSLARGAHDAVDAVIVDIDRRLAEFEAQLKKDGRWLPQGKAPVTPRTLAAKLVQQDRATSTTMRAPASPSYASGSGTAGPGPVGSGAASAAAAADSAKKPILATSAPATRAAQKSRARDSSGTGVSRASSGTGRGGHNKASKAPSVHSSDDDIVMDDGEDLSGDAGDASTVDTQLYCVCRNVSHGEMIGCEGKNCPIEWFHFECVGLTKAPEGTWLCTDCAEKESMKENTKMRRKGGMGRRKAV